MRVLSPKILPPAMGELGSTASTASFFPWLNKYKPKLSINVDLPTPGTPLMPMRILLPLCGKIRFNNCWLTAEDFTATEKRYRERLDFELGVILQMGFPGYFLI